MVHHKYLTFEPWPRIQNHPFLTASTRFSLLHNLGLMCLLHLLPSRLLSEDLRKQRLFAETALTFFKIGFLVIWLFDQIAYKCSMYLIEPVCTFSASVVFTSFVCELSARDLLEKALIPQVFLDRADVRNFFGGGGMLFSPRLQMIGVPCSRNGGQ